MKPVHIHVHNHATRDAWEESKHPRAEDGKFGSGGKALSRDPHKDRLKEADDNFDRHWAEGDKHGGYVSAQGKAHKEAASAWAKVRGTLNMNKPLDAQDEKHVAALSAAQVASKVAGGDPAPKGVTNKSAPPGPTPGRKLVRTYHTKSGEVGATVTENVGRDGRVTYAYMGKWGAGSGIDPKTMASEESDWKARKRGFKLTDH